MRLSPARVTGQIGFAGAALVLILSLILPAGEALAAASGFPSGAVPYFQATSGDVATGGWFNDDVNQVSCTGSGYYQAPDYSTGNYKIGGILSFDNTSAGRSGSHADYAAYSLGLVETVPASYYGFYTGNSGSNTLTFADYYASPPTSGFSGGGGLFEGTAGHYNWHCIPDYYKDYLQSSATNLNGASSINLSTTLNSGSNQYQDTYAAGSVAVGNGSVGCPAFGGPGTYTVSAGSNYTLFVNGNVYITSNIAYAAHNVNNIPRFALVVKGNIYVASCVTQLDGIYVAQPIVGNEANSGQFWTCQNNTGSWVLSNFGTSCRSSIVFNGSVIGAEVNLTRMGIGAAGFVQGETFNYSPDTPLGGSFTPPSSGSGGAVGQVDSLESLPPVF